MSYFINFPKLLYAPKLTDYRLVPNLLARVTFLREVLQNSDLYYKYSVKEGEKPEDVAYKFYQDPLKHWIILLANEITDPHYDWPMPQRSLEQHINKKYSSYTLKLNPSETYSAKYTVGETVYQGSSIDASSSDSTVVAYDSTNHKLTVNFLTDVIANNSIIAGSSSNVEHTIIGISCNNDGINWASNTISHYKMTEVKWNNYDDIKTTNQYHVSVKDFNNSSNQIIDRISESSESYLLKDGTTLSITKKISPVYYYDYEIELNETRRNVIIPKPAHIDRIEQEFKKLMAPQ